MSQKITATFRLQVGEFLRKPGWGCEYRRTLFCV